MRLSVATCPTGRGKVIRLRQRICAYRPLDLIMMPYGTTVNNATAPSTDEYSINVLRTNWLISQQPGLSVRTNVRVCNARKTYWASVPVD